MKTSTSLPSLMLNPASIGVHLFHMPADVWANIMEAVDKLDDPCQSIKNICSVERLSKELCENDELWKHLCVTQKFDERRSKQWHWGTFMKSGKLTDDTWTWRKWFAYCCHVRLTDDTIRDAVKSELGKIQPLNTVLVHERYGPMQDWDVSRVTDMSNMFLAQFEFNQDLSKWDVSSVTDMNNMFRGAYYFNQDISEWDVSSVTDMNNMFRGTYDFNQDISKWDVSKVDNMEEMFRNAINFNMDLSKWDVSSVTKMKRMFENAYFFNMDLSEWKDKLSKVKDASYMFANTYTLNPEFKENMKTTWKLPDDCKTNRMWVDAQPWG